jgi:hypothetical protein
LAGLAASAGLADARHGIRPNGRHARTSGRKDAPPHSRPSTTGRHAVDDLARSVDTPSMIGGKGRHAAHDPARSVDTPSMTRREASTRRR